jgi:hypothetical protein
MASTCRRHKGGKVPCPNDDHYVRLCYPLLMIHIVHSEATADAISMADVPGDIVVFSESLDDGALSATDMPQWAHLRAPYLVANAAYNNQDTAIAALTKMHEQLASALQHDEVVLWCQHDVSEQLLLIRMLSELARNAAPANLTMVSIDRHPAVANFLQFAQLPSQEIAALWPQRTPIARDAFEEAAAAWVAVTSQDPRAVAFIGKRARALPFLTGALERWLEEFPDTSSGLGRSERQMLSAIARGNKDIASLLVAAHAVDPRYPLTSTRALRLTNSLARAGLIAGSDGAFEVTADGKSALASSHDRVIATGVDTWFGGVHLHGKGPTWRWDNTSRKLTHR